MNYHFGKVVKIPITQLKWGLSAYTDDANVSLDKIDDYNTNFIPATYYDKEANHATYTLPEITLETVKSWAENILLPFIVSERDNYLEKLAGQVLSHSRNKKSIKGVLEKNFKPERLLAYNELLNDVQNIIQTEPVTVDTLGPLFDLFKSTVLDFSASYNARQARLKSWVVQTVNTLTTKGDSFSEDNNRLLKILADDSTKKTSLVHKLDGIQDWLEG